MAKKKTTSSDSGDRHSKRWVLNLPLIYRPMFERLAQEGRRTLVSEVSMAFEAYLKAAGLWPPTDQAEEESDDS